MKQNADMGRLTGSWIKNHVVRDVDICRTHTQLKQAAIAIVMARVDWELAKLVELPSVTFDAALYVSTTTLQDLATWLWSKPMGSILEPILVEIGMFTGGTGFGPTATLQLLA